LEIKKQPFFEGIDWEKLKKKEIEAPFKPKLSGNKDLRYFDKMFLDTPIEESVPSQNLNSVAREKSKYGGFTYMEPNHL